MMTVSPERSKIATGLTSRVRPRSKTRLHNRDYRWLSASHERTRGWNTYETDTSGEVAQTSDRSTWAINVS